MTGALVHISFIQEVAKKILTEYGFALLKSKAPDVLGDTRGANCLVIYPPAATASAATLRTLTL
jgi:hypothetical protein